jgi:hypothetical protein
MSEMDGFSDPSPELTWPQRVEAATTPKAVLHVLADLCDELSRLGIKNVRPVILTTAADIEILAMRLRNATVKERQGPRRHMIERALQTIGFASLAFRRLSMADFDTARPAP